MTMEVIQHYEVGAGGLASIVLSNIPQTHTHLYLVVSERNASSSDVAIWMALNGVTTGYSVRRLIGTGSSAIAQTFSERMIGNSNGTNTTASVFSNTSVYIPNYTSSNAKIWSADSVSENDGGAYQSIMATSSQVTAAITSLTIAPNGGSFTQYSSATLYGVLAGSDGTTTVS